MKNEVKWFIIIILTLLVLAIVKLNCYPFTKIYVGEDSGMLIYGIQSNVEFVQGISYYGEVESWLRTDRDSFQGWQLDKVEYTLRLEYDNFYIQHTCQHYLLEKLNDWDSQNIIGISIDLPNNTDRRK